MKYTQIPTTTFKKLQMNAGILVDSFVPATGAIGNLLGATTGGVNFSDAITFQDFGDDIDNCPKNMMELKKIESREVKMSGTFLTVDANIAKMLVGAGDIDSQDSTHIVPRSDLEMSDFTDLWWIGDYSDVNTGASAGFLAVHLMRALNTSGFAIQSTDKGKGQFAFEFTGHYSMDAQDEVPYEIFVKSGSEVVVPSVTLDKHVANVEDGSTVELNAVTVPATASVVWSSADENVATVSGGVVTGEGAGNTIITAEIVVSGVTYSDTCTVIVTAVPTP